jgi:hypothetical protein
MLSIVVYGRNDSHGYNLHKRAALSLNAMAEQLTNQDDEIVFVDYNTPDEIPTFPEAIADTLTATAKRRMRVIRVRPAFHAQIGMNTRLGVLEPQSRNIGFRRSNDRNPWVLSTNTDMLFVPKQAISLTDIVANLADGFYHLPRFELPEGFWESLPRSEPEEVTRQVGEWARRFHLDEITYGDFNNLYEAPGDFQLFRRGDIERICGLDESMILGWHVDSNFARRMYLLKGEVKSLTSALSGYHCGHTRQATIYHSHIRTENDMNKYCRFVESAELLNQFSTWGAPDWNFEEFSLDDDRSTKYFAALERAIPAPAAKVYEGRFPIANGETRDHYDVYHILPYLCDLLTSGPSSQRVLFLGSDDTLLEGLHAFFSATGVGSVIISDDYALLREVAVRQGISVLPREQAFAEADCFVLQFPESRLAAGSRKDEQWRVVEAVDQVADVELKIAPANRRRVIVVNSNDNPMQRAVEAVLSYTVMPYSCRIRHGYVIESRDPAGERPPPTSAWSNYLTRIDRGFQLSAAEIEVLRRGVEELSSSAACEASPTRRLALEIDALADNQALVAELAIDSLKLEGAASRARAIIAETRERHPNARLVGPRVQSGNRICSGLDWEDATWRAVLSRAFYGPPYGIEHRSRWTWARVSIQAELERQLDRHTRGWVLLVASGPDIAAAITASRGFKVAYATPEQILTGAPAVDWSSHFVGQTQGILHADLLPYSEVLRSMPPDQGFDAIVMMEGVLEGLLASGRLNALLKTIGEGRMELARLIASPLIRIDSGPHSGAFSYEDWRGLFRPEGALAMTGLRAQGDIDDSIPLDTLIKFSINDDQGDGVPGLSFGHNGVELTVALVSAAPSRVPPLAIRDGAICASLHGRNDVRTERLGLSEGRLYGQSRLKSDLDAVSVAPPPAAWAYGVEIDIPTASPLERRHIVIEMEPVLGSWGVGVLDGSGEFLTRAQVPRSTRPVELWLEASPDAHSVVVQNWTEANGTPATLKGVWLATQAT